MIRARAVCFAASGCDPMGLTTYWPYSDTTSGLVGALRLTKFSHPWKPGWYRKAVGLGE